MKTLILIIFNLLIFFCNCSYCQTLYEFFGVLKIGKDEKQIITYKLVFQENKGLITGYSITDLNGPHETKNEINGTYSKREKKLSFKENEIIYTKSKINKTSFCFVNFTGDIKLVENTSKIAGKFIGLYKNNSECISGSVLLIGSKKLYSLINKLNLKINNSNKITEVEKKKFNINRLVDSMIVNQISGNENLQVFWKSDVFNMDIWDAGNEDGDVINLYHNDVLILKDCKIEKKKKNITVNLITNKNVFTIECVSEGLLYPNTSKIELYDNNRSFDLRANLKIKERASITIIKNE